MRHKCTVKKTIAVFNRNGKYLSHCTSEKAKKLIQSKRAVFVNATTIKLKIEKSQKTYIQHGVINEAKRICYICNNQIPDKYKATVDHVMPKSRDAMADIKFNMRCCCERCNKDKGNRTLSEYVLHIKKEKEKNGYKYISAKRLDYLEEYAKTYERDYYDYTKKLLDGGEIW